MNDKTCHLISTFSGNRRFALDLYMRFLMNFGTAVLGLPLSAFDDVLKDAYKSFGVSYMRYFNSAQLE